MVSNSTVLIVGFLIIVGLIVYSNPSAIPYLPPGFVLPTYSPPAATTTTTTTQTTVTVTPGQPTPTPPSSVTLSMNTQNAPMGTTFVGTIVSDAPNTSCQVFWRLKGASNWILWGSSITDSQGNAGGPLGSLRQRVDDPGIIEAKATILGVNSPILTITVQGVRCYVDPDVMTLGNSWSVMGRSHYTNTPMTFKAQRPDGSIANLAVQNTGVDGSYSFTGTPHVAGNWKIWCEIQGQKSNDEWITINP